MPFLTPPDSPSKIGSTSSHVGCVFESPKGRVELVSRLGRGSFGSVYSGRTDNGTKCAVKVVPYDSCSNAFDFQNEEEILEVLRRQMAHPHVVLYEGSDCHADELGLFFFGIADHGSLEDFANNAGGRLDVSLGRRLLDQIYDGLAFIHSHGIYHRDIKPSNLLMVSCAQVQIADFGRSHLAPSKTVPLLTDQKGTKPFLPPDAFTGNGFLADAGDLWAAVITFVTITCGAIPWKCALLTCTEFSAFSNGDLSHYWQPLEDYKHQLVGHMRINACERTVDEGYLTHLRSYQSAKQFTIK